MNNFNDLVKGGDGKTHPTVTNKLNDDVFMSIDWLTATFDFIQFDYTSDNYIEKFLKEEKLLDELYSLLTFSDSSERERVFGRFNGYQFGYVQLGEFIRIYFGGAVNKFGLKHHKLEMSGQACQDFVNRGGNWYKLLKFLMLNGANFTRIDCAIDVMTDKYFNLEKLYYYAKNRYYVSPLRQGEFITSWDGDDLAGDTLYIGSMHSNTFICIYDKKLEQFRKGIEIMNPAWIRIEIRYKQERANWFVSEFLNNTENDNDFSFIAESLYAILEFKEKPLNSFDSNRTRWPTSIWWLDFISVATKADFKSKVKYKQTLERKVDWLNRAVSKTLLQLYHLDPNTFIPFILEVIENKSEDFDKTDLSIINNYRVKNGLDKLTIDDIVSQKELLQKLL